MRGISLFIVLSALLMRAAPTEAADLASVEALAREKAAAVSILRTKASKQIATLAQDRIFLAYLNAPTQGQGDRLRARMAQMLTALWDRFGLRAFRVVDRSGALVVRLGHTEEVTATFDVKADPVLAAGFAQAPRSAATVASADALTFAAPVVWRKQSEFVVSGRQALTVYRKVLARGVNGRAFAVLLDAKGRTLADTRASAPGAVVAGMSFDAVRRAIKGSSDEGAGEVAHGGEAYFVSYRKAGDWTIVAGAPVPPPRRCPNAGERLCG